MGMRIRSIIPWIILVAILIYTAYTLYSMADEFTRYEIKRKGKGYVSDEVWYVSSARNILIKIFHQEPRIPGKEGATLILNRSFSKGYIGSLASRYNVSIVDTRYSDLKRALYVEAPDKERLQEFIREVNETYGVKAVVPGWRLPDHNNIQEYLNTEHPPLGKYLIALSIYLFGDYPTYWRYPSIAAGVLLILLIYLITYRITGNPYVAVIVAAFSMADQLFRIMGSIAMLDIFVAASTAASALALVYRRYYLSIVLAAIASTFKFSGLFIIIPIAIVYLRDVLRERGASIRVFIFETVFLAFITILITIAVHVIVAIPLIEGIGFSNWASATIGSFKWHTSIKCTSPGCPVSAAPWDWMLGVNGFAVYYYSSERGAVAIGNPVTWPIVFGLTILFLPAYKVRRRTGWPILLLYGILAAYILLWIIGGKTQYSFYAVQLLPYTYMALVTIPLYILSDRKVALAVVHKWWRFVEEVWRLFIKILI